MAVARHEIEEHIPRLRRYARALLRDPGAADDLVQDCLERALSRWHLWRREGDLRAWLFTIMHNVFANQRRRAGRRPDGQSLADLPAEPARNGGQIEHMAVLDMQAALGQLPEEQRQAVLLIALEGFSYAEVARVADVPIGTVMSRLSRGRERLRQLTEGGPKPSIRRVL
jgi:RNA polymerase sigma-70 factor (ECF subfamily)